MQAIVILLFLVGAVFGQIGSLDVTHIVDSAVVPKVSYVDVNFGDVETHSNELKDSVNVHSTNVQALTDSLALSNNSGGDSLVRQNAPRIIAPTITSPTINTGATFGFLTNNRIPYYNSGLTDSPNLLWDNTNSQLVIADHTASTGNGLLYRNNAGNNIITLGKSGEHGILNIYNSSGTENARIYSEGASWVINDFGVGTNAPGTELDVSKSKSGTLIARIFNTSATSSDNASLYIGAGGTSAGDAYVRYFVNGSTDWTGGVDNSDADKFKLAASAALGTNTRLTVTTGGLVGVGTSSPDSTLTVTGSGNVSGNLRVGGNVNGATATYSGNVDAATLSTGNETFDYDEGTFVLTWAGFSGTVTSSCSYTKVGKNVTIVIDTSLGTANASRMYDFSGIPAAIRPSATVYHKFWYIKDDAIFSTGLLEIKTSGDAEVYRLFVSGSNIDRASLGSTGTKGIQEKIHFSYNLE